MSYLDATCLCTMVLFALFICIPMIKEKYLINKSTNELFKKLDEEIKKYETINEFLKEFDEELAKHEDKKE